MTDTREATPRPWRVEEGTTVIWSDNAYDPGTNCVGCIVARIAQPSSWKGSRPTADEQEANAALIVRAVNHFDEAVEGLKRSREKIQFWASYASEYFKDKHDLEADLNEIDTLLSKLEASQ